MPLGAPPPAPAKALCHESLQTRLDQIDQRILMALQQDGRITNQALSERVGLSRRPCLERVRRLEREGLIRRYQAVLDIRRLQSCITVLAQIAMERTGRESRQLFERRLANTPEAVECFEVSGGDGLPAISSCARCATWPPSPCLDRKINTIGHDFVPLVIYFHQSKSW